ncbi:rRNA pseudouridine synthase [Candidatus Woesebacteria bacterium]|nr:rRNA pseudouridine synthase [Candidatus Woesebacteria bacterium]MCD8506784.1 rRNA pseudouridine synthase [Candidatus Woesebacteria bacterium]MCD8527692.1 rRNA pseudouridine synthase [Candidatus Woesebacteria bacterium]MCD8546338.1 rRNA pseudouridine synthase [Candidatus Woesebacteria bacterium]
MNSIKISKLLSTAGVASRRKAEELVAAGKVSVNGQIMTNVAERVIPGKDVVAVNGRILSQEEDTVVLMLNKPRGVVSTVSDPDGKETVMQFVPPEYQEYRLFPVGRLDEDSEGLILLTNDGDLAYRLTHPKFRVPKTYHVVIEGHLTEPEIQRLRRGVPLKGRKTQPADVKILERMENAMLLAVTIREGLHHQVRRMMQAMNHPVIRLRRVQMGPYSLGDLPSGSIRDVH